jgi:hypothetical protein
MSGTHSNRSFWDSRVAGKPAACHALLTNSPVMGTDSLYQTDDTSNRIPLSLSHTHTQAHAGSPGSSSRLKQTVRNRAKLDDDHAY